MTPTSTCSVRPRRLLALLHRAVARGAPSATTPSNSTSPRCGPRQTENPPCHRPVTISEPPTVQAESQREPDAETGPDTGPWTPSFDEADDLDGLLSARSPLLSRAFRTADRDGRDG